MTKWRCRRCGATVKNDAGGRAYCDCPNTGLPSPWEPVRSFRATACEIALLFVLLLLAAACVWWLGIGYER